MPQYPQQNFNAMRQDAIRRSREMQRRAGIQQAPPAPPEPAYIAESTPSPAGRLPPELQRLLQGWDGERLALLGLLYLLYKEGADAGLLLAIAYILL